MIRRAGLALLIGCGLAACDAADEVRVQGLPPLERPSREARVGLPGVAGEWRFAGWELAAGDSASLEAELPRLGDFLIETQRLDSLAGTYAAGPARAPLVGEVRRDSLISLVALGGETGGRFAAGRLQRDTLWIELSSLVERESWPGGARVAYVRGGPVATPFVRLHGAVPAVAVVDTTVATVPVVAEAAPPPVDSVPRAAVPGAAAPRPAPAATSPPARTAAPREAAPPAQRPAPPQAQPRTTPQAPAAEPPPAEPEPEPEPPPRPRIRLLGEPVPRDTTR